jgi:hypothetical protein
MINTQTAFTCQVVLSYLILVYICGLELNLVGTTETEYCTVALCNIYLLKMRSYVVVAALATID